MSPAITTAQSGQDMKDIHDAFSKMNRRLADQEDDFSMEDEYYLGRTVGAVILRQYRSYTGNPTLSVYLNKICRAIIINSPNPETFNGYHVMILDSAETNAFATTGGHIFITLGMINIADTEDMLAAVIAHEIAHIQLRYGIEMIQNSNIYQTLSAIADRTADVAGRGISPETGRQLFEASTKELINTMIINGYSQMQEFAADSYAIALLAAAGYVPSGLLDVLTVLAQNQPVTSGGFDKTHPDPRSRIPNIEKHIGRYNVQDTRTFFRIIRFNSALKSL
jgi:predicted Zn-dependent protease